MDILNNLGGLWAIGVVPSCLVPDWEIRAKDSGLMHESLIKEVVGVVSSGLVGLHMKGVLTGETFAVCRNYLALGGQSFPGH